MAKGNSASGKMPPSRDAAHPEQASAVPVDASKLSDKPQTSPFVAPGAAHDQYTIEQKKMDLEAGVLGKFFGSGDNAAVNIAGFAVAVALLAALIVTAILSWKDAAASSSEIWKIVTPIITMVLGFVFGKKS
ncbi:MAG TPA: hypothetical protein VGE74_04685 [Gemmata sp.]